MMGNVSQVRSQARGGCGRAAQNHLIKAKTGGKNENRSSPCDCTKPMDRQPANTDDPDETIHSVVEESCGVAGASTGVSQQIDFMGSEKQPEYGE